MLNRFTRRWFRSLLAVVCLAVLVPGCPDPDDGENYDRDLRIDPQRSRISVDIPLGLALQGSCVEVWLELYDPGGEPLLGNPEIELTSALGSVQDPEPAGPGIWTARIVAPAEPGTALVRAKVNGIELNDDARIEFLPPCDPRHREPSEEDSELALRWAPIVLQLEDGRVPLADVPTDFEFDGDNVAANNWDNLERYPLTQTVYWALISTRTHHFLFYAFYYPRRVGTFADNSAESIENAMTGMMVVIERDAEIEGPPMLIETFQDGQFRKYSSDPRVGPRLEKLDGPLLLNDDGRPRIVIQGRTHGAWAGTPEIWDQGSSSAGSMLLPEIRTPTFTSNWASTYQLIPLLNSLWAERYMTMPGEVFRSSFDIASGCSLPQSFDSSTFQGGEPIWAFDDLDDGPVARGMWFIDPAWAVSQHLAVEGPFSMQYERHPYAALPESRPQY